MNRKMEEPIIMNSLLEQREQLRRILADKKQDPVQLEEEIIIWVNNLLLAAATENEPGQVQLVPLPDRTGDQVKEDPPADSQVDYQHLGGGTSRIIQSGSHQKLS